MMFSITKRQTLFFVAVAIYFVWQITNYSGQQSVIKDVAGKKETNVYESYQSINNVRKTFAENIISAEKLFSADMNSNTSLKGLKVVQGEADQYFGIINQISNIKTVYFTVITVAFNRIIKKKLYAIHTNDCHSIITKSIAYRDIYNLNCTETLDDFSHLDTTLDLNTIRHYSIQLGMFDARRYTVNISEQRLGYYNVGFLHVIRNAYITAFGNVVTNGVHIQILQCRGWKETFVTKRPFYDRVFSIAQYWGNGYYHLINEDLPRMAIALSFLWEHSDTMIHVTSINSITKAFIQELGISPDRLVSGHIQVGTAYVPAGIHCGTTSLIPINLLSMFFRSTIKLEPKPDTIILIKRSATRWFDHHDAILSMLQRIAKPFNLTIEVFGDQPSPSLTATKYMFNRAVMVVAPHGAGLSNMVFSQPETCIIEGLCKKINLCFKHTAQTLGHVYYGIVPKQQCMQTTADDLVPHIEQCLRWKMRKRTP